jgi:hypothetical protein
VNEDVAFGHDRHGREALRRKLMDHDAQQRHVGPPHRLLQRVADCLDRIDVALTAPAITDELTADCLYDS